MVIGLATCECIFYDIHSLKEKRAILQRLITRLRNKYNVSVSEVDYQDLWQRTKIAIVAVTSSHVSTEKELGNCLRFIDSFPEVERTITNIEWL